MNHPRKDSAPSSPTQAPFWQRPDAVERGPADAWEIACVLDDYVLGHALRVAQGPRERPEPFPPLDRGEHPRLNAALQLALPGHGDETFDAGLEIILDGIERGIAGMRDGSKAPPAPSHELTALRRSDAAGSAVYLTSHNSSVACPACRRSTLTAT